MLTYPDRSAAATLRRRFADAIVVDWRKVVDYARTREIVARDVADLLDEALASFDAPARSELFHHYFLALDAVRRGDLPAAGLAVASLGNVLVEHVADGTLDAALPVHAGDGGVAIPAATPSFRLAPPPGGVLSGDDVAALAPAIREAVDRTWVQRADAGLGIRVATAPVLYEVAKYDERTAALSGTSPRLRVLDPGAGADVVEGLRAAWALLHETQPEQAGEITTLTEYVVPLAGEQFVGGSDIFLYGASFLRLRPEWSALCYADHLVHEAAHQLLHAAQELEPLLLNRDHLGAPSPIRSDPRPLYGSFHATFVFLRLALAMDAVLRSGRADLHDEAELRLHRHLLGLLQGLHIVTEHAELSPPGRAEVGRWAEVARDLVARYGLPDRARYLRVDWDYEPANPDLPLVAL